MAREVMVGWARMVVPAGVGAAVAVPDLLIVALVLFVATMWHLTWSWAEINIDIRFGVLLGYAPIRHAHWLNRVNSMREMGSDEEVMIERLGLLGQEIGPRHSRARARTTNAPLLPHLPHPRREAMLRPVVDE